MHFSFNNVCLLGTSKLGFLTNKINKTNECLSSYSNFLREMLICALRAQDKDLKIELNNKYCIEKISF